MAKSSRQLGAIPVWMNHDGLQVLLITSRETKRWIIPKGWPVKGLSAAQAAAREAYEEAGIKGAVENSPFGRFRYEKKLRTGRLLPCTVDVYLIHVKAELEDWPERKERQREWMPPARAALLIQEGGLSAMLLKLAAAEG